MLGREWMGMTRMVKDSTNSIRVAVIQGNISQDVENEVAFSEATWRTYRKLTLEAARAGVDLVVWPETVVPGYILRDGYTQACLAELATRIKADMLVGGWYEDSLGRAYNSAFLIGPGKGVIEHDSKVHLVPFGEFVPARKYLPFLRYYRVRPCDTSPGLEHKALDTGKYKIGTAICFESTFPYILRKQSRSGAELLCVITDDEWFGRTSAAEQHMAHSAFRAVENSRYLVRAAATGISCIIDPNGRILTQSSLFTSSIINHIVLELGNLTFYTIYGDWLVYVSIALVAIFAVVAFIRRPKKERL
jgi:apolipoprotein N-acyltransferase